jgi:hypothetical protein
MHMQRDRVCFDRARSNARALSFDLLIHEDETEPVLTPR